MLKNFATGAAIALSFQSLAFAQSTSPFADITSPVAKMEAGKIKRVKMKDLPPGLRKVAEDDLKKNPLGSSRGYGHLPEEAMPYLKNYHGNMVGISEIKRNSTSKLADVSKTELEKYTLEGAIPEGPTKKGPWSSMSRVYKRPDGVVLMLHEWDYVKDGGGIVIVDELMNTTVSGTPARFSLKKSPSGEVLSELTWATKQKYFTLTVMGEVANDARFAYNLAWMTRLASGISTSAE